MSINNCSLLRINQAYLSFKFLATWVVAIIMFVFKQWGRKFGMNRDQRSTKNQRIPRSAVNLAYDPESDFYLFARSKKGMNVNVSSFPVNRKDTKINEKASVKVKHPLGKESEERVYEFNRPCKCQNCRVLVGLTECGVCFETLQSSQIMSCSVCANIICIGCSSRIKNCAFCRSSLPPERNRGLERFVDRLFLPCKNSKSGCKVVLNGESRFIHESICNFSATTCPVGRGICGWCGTTATIQSHLRTAHMLQPLQDHGFSVQFNNFRSKAKDGDGSVYTVCLSCYEQLFVIRVILFNNRLRLCFTRLGHEEEQPLTLRPVRYGVSVLIKAHAGRQMRGLVPFGKYDRETREITIAWENLYPKDHNPSWSNSWSQDHVEIDLMIKQIDEA